MWEFKLKPRETKIRVIKDKVITEAPKVADEFILSFALKKEFCFIVSNDKFREYIDQLPSKEWLEERRVSFMFLGDEVCLSPNCIDIKKHFLFKKKENVIKHKTTTLDVFDSIKNTEGEFKLF